APVPGVPVPRGEPGRSGRRAAALPGRAAARFDRALELEPHGAAPGALRARRGGAQVVDAVLRSRVRLLGRAAAETRHARGAGVRQPVPHERRPFDSAFTRWMLRQSDGYLVMSETVERDLDRLKP